MSFKLEKITEQMILGEGPHWDERVQALYFVCIPGKEIHKYVPATGEHTRTKLDGRVGFVVPLESTTDQFVAGVERQLQVVQWDGREGGEARVLRTLHEVDPQSPRNRLNDGKADPRGRLFAGTMSLEDPPGVLAELENGSLFRVDSTGIKTVQTRVGLSNGLAWDLQAKAMYYVDSAPRQVYRYDYDVDTGDISNRSVLFDFNKNDAPGFPDGMTIDTQGNLWVAVFGGSCVLKIDPKTSKILQKIPIPALQVTSVTFGGPDLDILFVTTACLPVDGKGQDPPCGSTYMITGLGVKGYPNSNFKL